MESIEQYTRQELESRLSGIMDLLNFLSNKNDLSTQNQIKSLRQEAQELCRFLKHT